MSEDRDLRLVFDRIVKTKKELRNLLVKSFRGPTTARGNPSSDSFFKSFLGFFQMFLIILFWPVFLTLALSNEIKNSVAKIISFTAKADKRVGIKAGDFLVEFFLPRGDAEDQVGDIQERYPDDFAKVNVTRIGDE